MQTAGRFAGSLADTWIGRKPPDLTKVEAARAAVAHLKPIVAVTGGSRGIGAALAMRFAEAGHDVALIARHSEELSITAHQISQKTNRTVIELLKDVSGPAAAEGLENALVEKGYYIDVLINNAGVGLSGSFSDLEPDHIDGLIDTNIRSVTRLMLHALPPMRARRRGGILNVASLGGAVPGPYQGAYYASKAYVISLTEAVAAETSGEGIRISVLVPGPVNTSFHAAMGAQDARYRTILPAQSPETVARIAYRGYLLGQRVIVPGLFNRLAFAFLRFLPHPITVPVMAWLLSPPSRTRD
jgi:uncharacterized protein